MTISIASMADHLLPLPSCARLAASRRPVAAPIGVTDAAPPSALRFRLVDLAACEAPSRICIVEALACLRDSGVAEAAEPWVAPEAGRSSQTNSATMPTRTIQPKPFHWVPLRWR